jgi:DNA-binding response OmpR family regulator
MRQLLIIEDDPSIRESLVDFFRARDFHVLEASTMAKAQALLADQDFCAVLLDLQLPDGDGLGLLRELRRKGGDTPVLLVTARGEEKQRIQGLEAGADDYIVKPFSAYELSARLGAVLRRSPNSQGLLQLGSCEIDLDAYEIRRKGKTFRLLQKEAELLRFFLRRPGQAFTREEILRHVWGYDAIPTTRTVDTHVYELRRKLEDDPGHPCFLKTVHGLGYRLVLKPS